jgi:hypothetical protein
MASWAAPLPPARRLTRAARRGREPRQLGVLRLGQHVVSDRDARLLAERLGEAQHHLAAGAIPLNAAEPAAGTLCEAARARVAEDLKLVSAALARSHSRSWPERASLPRL